MTALYALLFSVLVAGLPALWLNGYFSRQATRSWLGLSHSITGWDTLFHAIETRFSFRRKDVEKNLIQAGIYNTRLAGIYFPAKIGLAVVLMGSIFLFREELDLVEQSQLLAACMGVMVAVILGPDIWLQRRKVRRIRKVSSQLPYLLDLMSVCVQTGMTIEAAIALPF